MAKKKNKTSKSKKRSTSSGGKMNAGNLFSMIGIAVAGFLATNYGSKLIKGKDDLVDAGYKVLLPQIAGIASPLVIKNKAKMLAPFAVGSGIALLLGLIETIPQDPVKKAKLTNMALITGDSPLDMDDEDVLDLSDLDPTQQALLGKYIMTGAGGGNADPLGSKYVVTGDNKDPLA